jgi:hypothetical protein
MVAVPAKSGAAANKTNTDIIAPLTIPAQNLFFITSPFIRLPVFV